MAKVKRSRLPVVVLVAVGLWAVLVLGSRVRSLGDSVPGGVPDSAGAASAPATRPAAGLGSQSVAPPEPVASAAVAGYSFDLVRTFQRETDAFTQGLIVYEGRLFEGTGLYGESSLRETILENGRQAVIRRRMLPDRAALFPDGGRDPSPDLASGSLAPATLFGEGIAIVGTRIYQLTWMEGVCLVWNLEDWSEPVEVFQYAGEGWGLAYDGTSLIMSDGSPTLQFRDPETFAVTRSVEVVDPRSRTPIPGLNELEYIDGRVFANVYGSRRLAVIDPETGRLEAYVLLDGRRAPGGGVWRSLMPAAQWDPLDARWDVLNGIAHDPEQDHLLVTGKRWPTLYEITLRQVTDRF